MHSLATKTELSAFVYGKEYTQIPNDLFIPPDALEVLLDSFSGPLDLLLYLIRKQNINIMDIPIVTITKQYLQYIAILFQSNKDHLLELAADYLLMASLLAEIKSKYLLPKLSPSEEESDPRMDLVQQLQAYEAMKEAAQRLDSLARLERDHFLIQLHSLDPKVIKNHPEVALSDLMEAMSSLLKREECYNHHEITRENLSVRDRMRRILLQLKENKLLEFEQLFSMTEGRQGLIVSFLAILELARLEMVIITQTEVYSKIYIRSCNHG